MYTPGGGNGGRRGYGLSASNKSGRSDRILGNFLAATAVMWLALSSPAQSQSLSDEVLALLTDHPRVAVARHEMNASYHQVREVVGRWYPELIVTADAGHERYRRDDSKATHSPATQFDITLSQKIWDFGKTNADIRAAEFRWSAAKENYRAAEHELIFDAVQAYLNLLKSYKILHYAQASEDNIKRQSNVETALVESGRGYQTDVLQAKAQLAGAEARKVQAEGFLDQAISRYQAVFLHEPPPFDRMSLPASPDGKVYADREAAVQAAYTRNPQLKAARMGSQSAAASASSVAADKYAPLIRGVVESTYKDNIGGLMGNQLDQTAKVQVSFPFNLGFTAINSVSAAKETHQAAVSREGNVKISLEDQVKRLFSNMGVMRKRAQLLHNQAKLSENFLKMAREERQINRRSLIDILQGETQLYNAQSDAFSADADVLISTFALLQATGDLTAEMLEGLSGFADGSARPVVVDAAPQAGERPTPAAPERKVAVAPAAPPPASPPTAPVPAQRAVAATPDRPASPIAATATPSAAAPGTQDAIRKFASTERDAYVARVQMLMSGAQSR